MLSPGTRLGPYVIEAALGAGGMGEVYRARDTKLDREVAIKVLPPHLAIDEAARARFEREARTIAALSHPNILAIYDFGQHHPSTGSGQAVGYAVTELLDGETLRARLADHETGESALPLRKALHIAAEIAHGLAAAHDKGVVHRDVKPDNAFVTSDGRVKILDFGLARQAAAREPADDRTMPARTEAGTVMGTVGYMSPEQVRGTNADHRSDIFSLGCVLYEMAVGRRAFERETAAETMTAILREDPPDTAVGTARLPAALDQIVRHCLEKRPEERFQSARDLAFALEAFSGSMTGSGPLPGAPVRRTRRPVALLAAGLVLAALAIVATYAAMTRRAPRTTGEGEIVAFSQVTDQPGIEADPSLSPDGRSVVYARTTGSDSALWLQRVGARNATRLSPQAPASDSQPAFSPDGERVAFRSERGGGGIFLMNVSGESVTRLTDFGYSPSWSPDGRQIAIAGGTFFTPMDIPDQPKRLTIVTIDSGQRREVPVAPALQPVWSPHGLRIAYWGNQKGGQRDIWTIAAAGSGGPADIVPVTDDAPLDWGPTWSPDGGSLYFSSTRGGTMNLWRVPIDERSGRVLGEPQPVTTPSTWSGSPSFSRDGTRLAFATLDYRSTLFRAPFDAAREALAGPPVPVLKGTRPIRDHQLSPDGQWVAFTEAGVQEDLFVARIDGSEYRRLTDDAFRDRGAGWAPDGGRIAFYSDRGGRYDIWTIHPDGSGLSAMTEGAATPGFPVWAPDGRRLAFGFAGWYVVDAGQTKSSRPSSGPLPGPEDRFVPTDWSPIGDRVVGQRHAANKLDTGIAVYSVGAKQFATVPGEMAVASWLWPAWLGDGRRLLVRTPAGLAIVDSITGAGHSILQVGGNMIGRSAGVSRDNRWITYTETATEGDIWIATVRKPAVRDR